MSPEVPAVILKEVFGNVRTRDLLLLLEASPVPVRYSAARAELGFRPEEFQRALSGLQKFVMVQYRAPLEVPAEGSRPPRNAVYLELTMLGKLFASLYHKMNDELIELMEQHHIPQQAISALAEG